MNQTYASVQQSSHPSTLSVPQGDLKPAPEYCASTLDGKTSCLADFTDKVTIVNVWATWCIPCREEMPALEDLYKEFSHKGLEIIGVSVDGPGSQNRIKTFADRMGITYTILHDPDDKFTRVFRTIGVPESFLINQEGQIVHTWKGPFDAMSQDSISRVSLLIGSSPNTNESIAEDSIVTSLSNQQKQNQVTTSSSGYETIGYPVAFVAGVLSFLSPCILPLIPSYVAFITGMSIEELGRTKRNTKSERDTSASDKPEVDKLSLPQNQSLAQLNFKHTAIVRGLLFIAGFSLVFISLGASITAIGAAFSDYTVWIERVGGILLVIFGLNLLGILKIPAIQRDWAIHFSKRPIAGHLGSFVIGMGFGAGWTPCIGPILASILTIAASSSSIMTGVNLLAVYSAGLAIPFIISTIAIERFLIAFRKFRKWLPWVNRASAAMLIIIGIILLTGFLTLITSTLSGFQLI
jgi:cytochrome c-type biogenesis protein